jgi:hypothetical protein
MQITALNFNCAPVGYDADELPPAALAVVVASIGRTLVLETGTRHDGRSRRGPPRSSTASSTNTRCPRGRSPSRKTLLGAVARWATWSIEPASTRMC